MLTAVASARAAMSVQTVMVGLLVQVATVTILRAHPRAPEQRLLISPPPGVRPVHRDPLPGGSAGPARPPASAAAALTVWAHAAADLHRASAGRRLRDLAVCHPGRRGTRLRRVLPLRPLPDHGRVRPARPNRRLGHPRWPGQGNLADPAGHADEPGHVPPPRATGDHRGAGGPDERWPGRTRPRYRLVRRRAHRLWHTVPAAGRPVRPPGRATEDHHRAVGDRRWRKVLVRRHVLLAVQ